MAVAPLNIEYVSRMLDLRSRVAGKSHFLFGPRQTGKSTLIRNSLPDAVIFDLNVSSDFLNLSRDPSLIGDAVMPDTKIVVIDEIQKAPNLLNEVHHIIESQGVHFLLTGSSARKLRQKGVNLLGGRARVLRFHPLTLRELGDQFDLVRALSYGTLPSVYLSSSPRKELDDYVDVYLREEIRAEGVIRNLESFSRVLEIAALCNATIVNFEKVASDAQVPRSTVREHFEILKDTLVLFELPAWREGLRRKPNTRSKYYFFDPGIVSAVLRRNELRRGTSEFGFAFESWLMHELSSWIDYQDVEHQLSHWRSHSGYEVDFLIGDTVAIEAKATSHVSNQDLRNLKAIEDEYSFKHRICVSLETRPRIRDGIEILPYQVFLNNLWDGAYVK